MQIKAIIRCGHRIQSAGLSG